MSRKKSKQQFVGEAIKYTFCIYLALLGIFVTSRIFEQVYMSISHGFVDGQIQMGLLGLTQDISLASLFSIALLPVYTILLLISKRLLTIFLVSITVILSAVYNSLIVFFQHALKPLDGVIFQMSYNDMLETVTNTASVPISLYAYFFLHAILLGLLCILLIKKFKIVSFRNTLLVSVLIVFSASLIFLFKPTMLKSYKHYFQNNKLLYPFSSFFPNELSDIENYSSREQDKLVAYYQGNIKSKEFVNDEYPFLTRTEKRNPIGNFFIETSEKPSIVLIIVESLGTQNSYPNPYNGVSFTPFLDSLAQNGLYWSNFYANHERTFGVLPTILGSLPSAKKGFNELDEYMPFHISLPRLLGKNGYHTTFYYGGWIGFDRMNSYLFRQNFSWIESGAKTVDLNDKKEFCWGDNDLALYERAIPLIKEYVSNKPRLDVLLTLSTHEPYKFPEKEVFERKFEALVNNGNLSESQRKELKFKSSHLQSILFADSAIHYFFNEVKKMERFKNTIFIITGDHSLPMFTGKYFERYHIPLIVYSPLLKESKAFDAFGSQLDITPTIAAFLADGYDFILPDSVSWLGSPLDTSSENSTSRFVPIMQTNRECNEYFFMNQFHSLNETIELVSGNKILNEENSQPDFDALKLLKGYLVANHLATKDNRLVSPEDFLKYSNIRFREVVTDKTLTNSNQQYHSSDSVAYSYKLRGDQYFVCKRTFFPVFNRSFDNCQDNTLLVKGTYECFYNGKEINKLPVLSLSIDDSEGENIKWLNYEIKPRLGKFKKNAWNTCEASFLVKLSGEKMEKPTVKIHFYNPKKESVAIKNLNFEVIIEKPFETF